MNGKLSMRPPIATNGPHLEAVFTCILHMNVGGSVSEVSDGADMEVGGEGKLELLFRF